MGPLYSLIPLLIFPRQVGCGRNGVFARKHTIHIIRERFGRWLGNWDWNQPRCWHRSVRWARGLGRCSFHLPGRMFIIFYSFIKLCIGTADVIHHFMICYWAICQPRFLVSKYVGCWSDCSTFIAYHCPMSWMSSTFLLLTFWSSNVFCRFQFQMGTLFKPKNMPPCDQKWVVFWMQNLCSEWDRWLGFFWPRPIKHQSHKRGKLDWGDGA